MSDPALATASLATLAARIRKKEVSPVEVVESVLDRIAAVDPRTKAYVTVTADAARREARQAEQEIGLGRYRGPLHGIPIGVKDLFYTRGVTTAAGSKILAGFVPDHDAAAVERLRNAGAILVGKTNTHEFAYSVFSPPTRNPWDLDRIPGGSSGGSAAAVAASLCTAALGTDTGGSIRIPSALCGVVGLKPTYGRVSKHGVVPLSWSADHVGPIARSVEDAMLVLAGIAGWDPRDPASADTPVPEYAAGLTGSVRGLRIGLPREYYFEGIDPEVEAAVRAAIRTLEGDGALIEEVSLPSLAHIAGVHVAIVLTEAATYHEKWLRTRADEYAPDVRFGLEWGKLFSGLDYVQAQRVRALIKQDFAQAFTRVDLLAAPTVPVPAPRVGEGSVTIKGQPEGVLAAMIRLNRPSNHTGLPAVSVPCGFTAGGLPIGLQLIGRAFDEATVLRAAHAYEQRSPWRSRTPTV